MAKACAYSCQQYSMCETLLASEVKKS